jgi:hypothetical protein
MSNAEPPSDARSDSKPADSSSEDFGTDDLATGPGFEVISLGQLEGVDADVEGRREWVRAAIALCLVGIFAFTVLGALGMLMWTEVESEPLKTLLEILLPAETALLGSAIGFYYGTESAKKN